MSNPWTKKNPWMSLWLSAAHQVGNRAAGQAKAQTQAQINRAPQQGLKDATTFWSGWMLPPLPAPPAPPAKRSRSAKSKSRTKANAVKRR
jgi:hypothetical protein